MIYDFKQEMVIISKKNEKKSQMEVIMENCKSQQSININEDSNYPNISFENNNKEIKDKNNKKKEKKVEYNNIIMKEKEYEKEISYALSKKDEQKTIIFFYGISILFLLISLSMSFFEIYFIIYEYLKLKENIKLVIYATNLKYFTNFGIYYIRENILYNIDNSITDGLYNIPDENPEIYKSQISNIAKKTFIDCNSILELIIGSSFDFCKDTKYILTEKLFDIEIIYNNNKIKNVSTNLYSSMIQVYSSFCNLLVNYEYISINDPNLYNFIHNSFNNLGNGLNTLLQLFVYELKYRESYILIKIIIYCCIYLFSHIILYLMISASYCSIAKRKTSYIEVFYGIGLSLIKSSIKKCEKFISKINHNYENTQINVINDETSSFISSSNLNNILLENNFEKTNINNNKKKNNKKQNIKKRKLGTDKKSKNFRVILQLAIISSFLHLIIVFLLTFF